MKILLLSPPPGRKELPIFPLGLAYIATTLKRHSIKIFALNLFTKPFEKLGEILEEQNPDIVGISLRNIDTCCSWDKFSYYPSFALCVRQIRKIKKDTTIIVGGTGFSLFPKRIMEDIVDIDFGVLFEGEETTPELLENLTRPQLVKGICYRNKGKVCFTGKRDFLNFDNLPLPEREMINLHNYKYSIEQIGVQTKRGCIFKCIYCTYPRLDGNRIRVRSPQKVVDEIIELTELGIKKIFFCDSIFNFPQEHAIQICNEIIRRNINIKWEAHFNEKFMNRKVLLLAKEAGCEIFHFGPDGSNSKMLKNLRKNLTYQEITNVYNLFRKENVNFRCDFSLNGPGENVKTIFYTLKLVLNLFLIGCFRFSIGNIRIYPHNELFYISLKKGLITKNTDLIPPTFYDPFPLRIISCFFNLMASFLYKVKSIKIIDSFDLE